MIYIIPFLKIGIEKRGGLTADTRLKTFEGNRVLTKNEFFFHVFLFETIPTYLVTT